MARNFQLFLLLILPPLFFLLSTPSVHAGPPEDLCVYTVYAKTGSQSDAGTDSSVSLELGDPFGNNFKIPDLKGWGGLMGPLYNYYEKGNLDIFSGRGPCLAVAICRARLSVSGFALKSSWFCDQLEVTMAAPNVDACIHSKLHVQKKINNKVDFLVDLCHKVTDDGQSIISVSHV